jgi:hypothetical protein
LTSATTAGDGPDVFRATAFVDGDDWRVGELHQLAQAHSKTVGKRQMRWWVDDLAEISFSTPAATTRGRASRTNQPTNPV